MEKICIAEFGRDLPVANENINIYFECDDNANRITKSVYKRFFVFSKKIENSNKWLVNDGNDNDFEVINETNDSDYAKGSIIVVRLRTEQTYLVDQNKLEAKYYVEEVLETYKSILEI